MTTTQSAVETLDREFLEIRAELLRVAASLDRIERGAGDVSSDPRMVNLMDALAILQQPSANRAERLQMLFSLDYDAKWRANFGLESKSS